ncbi:hypothetical protein [Atopococcus tabaci]|uniref:hypothetical protein n=1 Tax=Atopococcus tabaci TaxID=269774 RepID=UPI000424F92B|nr:hypothetical protein [Atopococcus tabaci]
MKEWHITSTDKDFSLLIDKITLLKGRYRDWEEVIEAFQSYFSNKSSAISIFEDQTLLPRNDFAFHTISLDESAQNFEKALREIKQSFLNQLEFSPLYRQLVETWESLSEEVEFLSTQMNLGPAQFSMQPFYKQLINKHVNFSQDSYESLTNYEKVLFQLTALLHTSYDKKNIICLISPEKYLTATEVKNFIARLNSTLHGNHYFLITSEPLDYTENILYKNRIINDLSLSVFRDQLKEVSPIQWSDDTFDIACKWYRKLVDNSRAKPVYLEAQSVDNLEIFIYLYSLFILTDTPVIVDLSKIPLHLRKYFDDLIADTV